MMRCESSPVARKRTVPREVVAPLERTYQLTRLCCLDAALVVLPYRHWVNRMSVRDHSEQVETSPMSRFSPSRVVLLAAAGLLSSAGAARATCPIENAAYQGGAYGAYAVTTTACFTDIDENGGTGFTTAAASSVGLSSSATLASGVLTADSQSGFASSSIWDSFTYTGLPAGGTTITATLSVPATLTGSSDGMATLEEGTQTGGLTLVDTVFFNNATGQPEPLSLSFDVTNGAPVIVFAEIQVDGLDGVADLGDPPTLSLNLPKGASVTTASGVFDNFTSAPVPEPSTWAMMLLGFAGLGFFGYRQRRKPARAARV
jgi:hypothetical protein